MATTRSLFTAIAALFAATVTISDPGLARDACTGAACRQAKPPPAAGAAATAAKSQQAKPLRRMSRKLAKPAAPVDDNVMRGGDTRALIALLPWWRADEWEGAHERDEPVLAIAGAFVGLPPSEVPAFARLADGDSEAARAYAEASLVTDPGELNELDVAASEQPAPANQPWLHSLLAMFGGALAAASAARFLFV